MKSLNLAISSLSSYLVHSRLIHSLVEPEPDFLEATVITLTQLLIDQGSTGDILVFLPGQQDIESEAESLERSRTVLKSFVFLTVFAALPKSQQLLKGLLKLITMYTTLSVDSCRSFFTNTKHTLRVASLEIPGRTHPIVLRYLVEPEPDFLEATKEALATFLSSFPANKALNMLLKATTLFVAYASSAKVICRTHCLFSGTPSQQLAMAPISRCKFKKSHRDIQRSSQ